MPEKNRTLTFVPTKAKTMKEYVLFFRMDITSPGAQPTQEQMQQYMAAWMEWVNGISAEGRLAEGGNHLLTTGKVLYPKHETRTGPYTKDKESVAGYLIILAEDESDAIRIAQKCPILSGEGTSVEIRQTATPGDIKK